MKGRWRGRCREDEARREPDDSSGIARRTPLPSCPARGRLIVPEAVARATERALKEFVGSDGRRHEGIAFWAGRREGDDHLIGAAVIPLSTHAPGRVHVDARDVGAAANRARRLGIAILSQVHSHPGTDTRHSDGDDEMVLMPYEGMFSLVSARYGDGGVTAAGGVGVHQFQDERWVQVSDVERALVFVPDIMLM
jgi:hypothetical protein